MKKKIITTTEAPQPIGPYNQAILIGETLYISGQIGLDLKTNELVGSTIHEQTEMVLRHLQAILKAAELDFSHIVKSSIFVTSLGDFKTVNSIYGMCFEESEAPARETVEVSGLPKNAKVEISMIAVKP